MQLPSVFSVCVGFICSNRILTFAYTSLSHHRMALNATVPVHYCFIYLFDRHGLEWGQAGRTPVTNSCSGSIAQARRQELRLDGSPPGWQGPRYLRSWLLPSRGPHWQEAGVGSQMQVSSPDTCELQESSLASFQPSAKCLSQFYAALIVILETDNSRLPSLPLPSFVL